MLDDKNPSVVKLIAPLMCGWNKWKSWTQRNNSLIFNQLYCGKWITSVFTSSYLKKKKEKAEAFFLSKKNYFADQKCIVYKCLPLENIFWVYSLKPLEFSFKNTLFSYILINNRKPFFSPFLSPKTMSIFKKENLKRKGGSNV